MKHVKGDLIQLALLGRFDVIIHGCNCFCTMGAGIAKLIKKNFPHSFLADQKTGKGDKKKLGHYSFAAFENSGKKIVVINAYTQFNFSGHGVLVDYHAVKKVFSRIKKDFTNQRIGYPKIGAGLARGDWGIISKIINEQLNGEDHTLVEFG
jgi:O-acetyl-ADP-ribose deacetylase (regulator of RNase III)